MNKVPIDIGLLIKPVSSYRFEDVAEQLVKRSIPRFFDLQQPGGTLWQSELMLAVTCTPGVRTARIVRLSLASGTGGIPPERFEFPPDEIATLNQVEVGLDTEPTRPPFG
jgi:hypothetical protein